MKIFIVSATIAAAACGNLYGASLKEDHDQLLGSWILDKEASLALNRNQNVQEGLLQHLELVPTIEWTFRRDGALEKEEGGRTSKKWYRLIEDTEEARFILITEGMGMAGTYLPWRYLIRSDRLEVTALSRQADGKEVPALATLVFIRKK